MIQIDSDKSTLEKRASMTQRPVLEKTLNSKCLRLEGSNFRLGGIAPITRAVPSFLALNERIFLMRLVVWVAYQKENWVHPQSWKQYPLSVPASRLPFPAHGLSRYEQETIANYNAGEQTAILYTRDKAVMRKPWHACCGLSRYIHSYRAGRGI